MTEYPILSVTRVKDSLFIGYATSQPPISGRSGMVSLAPSGMVAIVSTATDAYSPGVCSEATMMPEIGILFAAKLRICPRDTFSGVFIYG